MQAIIAQDSTECARYGVLFGGGVTIHAANFQSLPGFPTCCPTFANGNGFVPDIAVFSDQPLTKGRLSLSTRLMLTNLSGRLSEVETQVVAVNGKQVNAQIEHSLDATIEGLGISPLLSYRFSRVFSGMLGARIDIPLFATMFSQEELLFPEVGTFENNRRIRNEQSGKIPDLQAAMVSGVLGVRFDIPVSKSNKWKLLPEFLFTFGLNSVTRAVPWNINGVHIGLGIAYQPEGNSEKVIETPAVTPTKVVEPEPKTYSISASVSVDVQPADTLDATTAYIQTEEVSKYSVFPLLNFVFFEQQSDALPFRYKVLEPMRNAKAPVIDTMYSSALDAYYDVLNILGSRLRAVPTSSVTLVGCIAESEKAIPKLAERRAQNVARYLQSVWGINPSRLKIVARALPAKPSSSLTPDGNAENRRVEIIADERIVREMSSHTILTNVRSTRLNVRSEYEGNDSCLQWMIHAERNGRTKHQFIGYGAPPAIYTIPIQALGEDISPTDNVRVTLSVKSVHGIVKDTSVPVLIRYQTAVEKQQAKVVDTTLHSFSLILFDVNSSELRTEHSEALQRLSNLVQTASLIEVIGSTDKLGDAKENEVLSQQRATAVATKLQAMAPQCTVKSIGKGDELAPYSHTYPEGRFYNRTVVVTVYVPRR